LVLQSGGASGSGFMSFQRLYEVVEQLKTRGEFHDGVFTWYDEHGKKHNQDGYEAAWEAFFQRAMSYPQPRYDGPVFFTPERFNWLPQAGTSNVYVRQLAQFHEHGMSISQLRVGS